MEYKDYYAVLGVPRTATEKEIRAAYRKLARQYHPDVNPGDKAAEARFKEINEAYEVLSDPEKRKRYDELGARWPEYEQWQRARAAGAPQRDGGRVGDSAAGAERPDVEWAWGPEGVGYTSRTLSEEDLRDLFGAERPFSDFFEAFFGRRGAGAGFWGAPHPRPGADLEHPVEVTLEEAYRGATRHLTLQTPGGETRRLEVKIPPGVTTGSRVRIAGQGAPGSGGGPPGDLYLVVTVRPDPRFERRGDDLVHRLAVPLTTLLLGGEARVPTPDGRTLALTVPAGTQEGQVVRLRGQGMPQLGRPERRGDLLVEVHARLPRRLTPRQRELVEELARLEAA